MRENTNKVLLLITAMVLMICLCSVCVFAEESSVEARVINMDSRSIEVKSVINNAKDGEMINLLVLNPEKSYPDMNISNEPEYVAYVKVGFAEDKKCEFSFNLPEGAPSGRYTVMVKNERDTEWQTTAFWYSDSEYAAKLLSEIKNPQGQNDSEKLQFLKNQIMNPNFAEALALNTEYINNDMYEPIASELIKNEFTTDVTNFNKVFYSCVISLNLQKEGTVEEKSKMLSVLGKYNGFIESELYNLYSNNQYLDDFFKEVKKNTDLTNEGLYEALVCASVNSELNNVLRWETVLSILEKYSFIIEKYGKTFNFDKYEKVDEKAEMIKFFLEKERKNINGLVTDFNDSVDEYLSRNKEKTSYENSAPKGGGSFFGGGAPRSENKNTNNTDAKSTIKQNAAFSDVGETHWAFDAVNNLASKNIISGMGNGCFEPESSLTRAQLVKIVCIAFNLDSVRRDLSYIDVKEDSWYYDYVVYAASNGVVNGKSETVFEPDSMVTREEMTAIIYRALVCKGVKFTTEEKVEFGDFDSISEYAVESVKSLVSTRIVAGFSDGEFKPKEITTRAQCAQVVYNSVSLMQKDGAK